MTATPHILVGVVPGQSDTVVTTAARFAKLLNAHVVCASVDSARLAIERQLDGSVISVSMSAELTDTLVERFDPDLEKHIGAIFAEAGVEFSTRADAGLASQQLSLIADEIDAEMIVVGTRDPGIRGTLHEFFSGSVAAQLSHRQHRPVLVVPQAPVGDDEELPWEEGAQAS
ncbi:universal stress protein [Demequina sp. NBRC 110051]|uniref:universal stress protein n=1 Tax=Demequina sp. NBRC 110051 TaxID=1570340 RepID=UPI000A069DCE|nr:universal stress protein [Demequina sp. NBRC 110051]